jgi:Flp pilus assembly protein TadB
MPLAAAVLAIACGVAVLDRRRRMLLDAVVWPWVIDEIEARVRDGEPLPTAVLGVALQGPPVLAAAAEDARRVWSSRGDARASLRELRRVAADPRVDRLGAAVDAVHALGGDATDVLARLRASAVNDARRERELARVLATTRCAAWLALIPVVFVASGHLAAAPATLAVAAAVVAWSVVAVAPGTAAPRLLGERR